MSTNYYARLAIRNSPVELKLHIGLSSGAGLSTISGIYFPTVEAWSSFLKHNRGTLEIEDEYGLLASDVESFIEVFLKADSTASSRQLEYLRKNNYIIHSEAPTGDKLQKGDYWLDGDRLFYNGEFF